MSVLHRLMRMSEVWVKAIDGSLEELGIDYIDLMLIHSLGLILGAEITQKEIRRRGGH